MCRTLGPRDGPQLGRWLPLIRRFVCDRVLVLRRVTACHVPSRFHGLPPRSLELLVLFHHAAELRAGVVQRAFDGSLADVKATCDRAHGEVAVVVEGDDLTLSRRKPSNREFEGSRKARRRWHLKDVRGIA